MISVYVSTCEDSKAGARALLALALRDLGLEPEPVLHDALGRPFLPRGPRISLSHTRGAAAVAVSDRPVGVDLERIRPLRDIAGRILSEPELRWYEARGRRREDLFTLWTLKEAWYKYQGTGLPGYPNGTEFYQTDGLWRLRGASQRFLTAQKDLLCLALCGEEQEVRITWQEESADPGPH